MTQPTRHQPTNSNNVTSLPGLDETRLASSEHEQVTQTPSARVAEPERKLVLTLEGKILREFSIGSHNLSIGRKYGNNIQLNDLTLSGRHALISSIPDYVFIEDLDSTNGTLVNGNHVKKSSLEHGDIIQVGHHQLTYICEPETSYEPTMFVKAELDETQFIYSDEINQALVTGLALGGLRTVDEPASKPVMELRKTYNTIGFQGKRMALITRGSEGYSITSVIGTRSRRASDVPCINDEELGTEQLLLNEGDVINIAGFEVQFYYLS
ncbi:MAG: FHA domain-containing protein [Gammaproteobacteria bacterium]|nr:FHA domain-containing protein [Gammaproteobacteria bacterium]